MRLQNRIELPLHRCTKLIGLPKIGYAHYSVQAIQSTHGSQRNNLQIVIKSLLHINACAQP